MGIYGPAITASSVLGYLRVQKTAKISKPLKRNKGIVILDIVCDVECSGSRQDG